MDPFKVTGLPPEILQLFLLAQGKATPDADSPRAIETAAAWIDRQVGKQHDLDSYLPLMKLFESGARARVGFKTYFFSLRNRLFVLRSIVHEINNQLKKKEKIPLERASTYIDIICQMKNGCVDYHLENLSGADFYFLLGNPPDKKSLEKNAAFGYEFTEKLFSPYFYYERTQGDLFIEDINSRATNLLKGKGLSRDQLEGYVNLVNKATNLVRTELNMENAELKIDSVLNNPL